MNVGEGSSRFVGVFTNASKSGDARFITSNNVNEYYGEEGNQMKILGKDGVWDTGDVGKTRLLYEEVLRRGSDGYLRE